MTYNIKKYDSTSPVRMMQAENGLQEIIYRSISLKNKAEECNEGAGLKATTSRQETSHNFFSRIDYLAQMITATFDFIMCKQEVAINFVFIQL